MSALLTVTGFKVHVLSETTFCWHQIRTPTGIFFGNFLHYRLLGFSKGFSIFNFIITRTYLKFWTVFCQTWKRRMILCMLEICAGQCTYSTGNRLFWLIDDYWLTSNQFRSDQFPFIVFSTMTKLVPFFLFLQLSSMTNEFTFMKRYFYLGSCSHSKPNDNGLILNNEIWNIGIQSPIE